MKPTNAPFEQGAMPVEVELTSGRLLSWAEYQEGYVALNDNSETVDQSNNSNRLSRFIHTDASVSQIAVDQSLEKDTRRLSGDKVGLETIDGGQPLGLQCFSNHHQAASVINQEPFRPLESFLALHFQYWEDTAHERPGCTLLIRDTGECWERVTLLDDKHQLFKYAKKTRRKIRLG